MAVLIPEPMSVDDAVRTLGSLGTEAAKVDCDRCDARGLDRLMAAVRSAQQALDGLAMRIGVAADHLADQGRGPGAHGLFLGAGGHVRAATARREHRRSETVAEFDLVAAAVADGRIGAAQVDVLADAATKLTGEQRHCLNQAELVAAAAREPVDVFARRMRRVVDQLRLDSAGADATAKQQASSWRAWFNQATGMGHVHGEFDPEQFEAIQQSIESQTARLANQGGVTRNANLAAQAAYDLLTESGSTGSGLPHIGVVIDWKTFSQGQHSETRQETVGGHPLTSEAVARLACHAIVQRVVVDDRGVPINVGRRHRTATNAQWLAIRAIYRACAWHGCERPLSWCQLHHVHEWENGGPTDLDNLVPLCSQHHHAVHEGGWSLKLWNNRRLDAYSPDGHHQVTTHPDRLPQPAIRRHRSPPPAQVTATTRGRTNRRPGTAQPAQPAGP